MSQRVNFPLRVDASTIDRLKKIQVEYRKDTIKHLGLRGKTAKAFPAVPLAEIARWVVSQGIAVIEKASTK